MKDLKQSREQINTIDKQMQDLFVQRMALVKDVVAYKIENNMEIFQKEREDEVIEKNTHHLPEGLKQYGKAFFEGMMTCSKDYQAEILFDDLMVSYEKIDLLDCKIGYRGLEGSFCYKAAMHYFKDVEKSSYEHFEDLYQALEEGVIDYGIVPYENSNTGVIEDNYDLLLKHDCYIVDQQIMDVKHHILALPDATLEDIHTLYCHPQEATQIVKFLKKYPHIKTLPFSNMGAAAKFVSNQSDLGVCVIASKEAAVTYDLDILAVNVQDTVMNKTKYSIVSKTLKINPDSNFVSIMFTLGHTPGTLARILQILQRYDINLTTITSRPIIGKAFEYYFYVDFQGKLEDPKVVLVLKMIEEYCTSLKIIGSYRNV